MPSEALDFVAEELLLAKIGPIVILLTGEYLLLRDAILVRGKLCLTLVSPCLACYAFDSFGEICKKCNDPKAVRD